LQRPGLCAEIFERDARISVLGVNDGFAGFDEGGHLFAPTLVETVLGQSPVEIRKQIGHLLTVVLQADGQAARVGFVRQPDVVMELILISQRETGIVGIGVYVIRLDAVETFVTAQIQAGAQDGGKFINLADVQPFFTRPAS